MTDWKNFFSGTLFRYIDQSQPEEHQPMASFAIDDALATSVGNHESAPTLRLWVHDHTLMLGIPDAKLPYIDDALAYLQEHGFQGTVRNSGGLAVVLDRGVLNMSLILPDIKKLGIHDGYDAMVDFTKYLFRDLTDGIEAYEVEGSYCPGEYDLSIHGKKFAGISQRRVKNGAAVQIYLCVEGDGEERAELVRGFYEHGLRGEKGSFDYPTIRPETMASLSQLLDRSLTVQDVVERIEQALEELATDLTRDPLDEQEQAIFEKRMEQMVERNRKVLG
ncbi:lipoate--protein ligase family protein [Aquibacillus sediminis]|uniref:lipoate--protein ligase family protein n=1 Tax=Aquibacillus sediminis TaxID=2574734 RepID=UPI0011083266|nr:biotin/lipoate A/B protein ligase family protein [Aquibacillus sediminis]